MQPWSFRGPVNRDGVADYYNTIVSRADLLTINKIFIVVLIKQLTVGILNCSMLYILSLLTLRIRYLRHGYRFFI